MPIARVPVVLIAALCVAACSAPGSVSPPSSDVIASDDVADEQGSPDDAWEAGGDGAALDGRADEGLAAGDGDTADAGPDAATEAAADGCAGRADGSWCDGRSLRACAGGRTTGVTACADGCYDRAQGSACASDAVDPCFNDPDGAYCGAAIGATLRTGDVWTCRDRRTAQIDACAMGCEGPFGAGRCRVAPMADPCARASSGDGAYCGASLGAGARDTLYQCRARTTASAMACAHGCAVRPPGQPDFCNPPPGGGGSGYRLPFACGARVPVTQGNNSSFSHRGTQAWAYDFGVPRGTAVMAMEAGTVSHANGSVVPGGRCWNGGGSECANVVNYLVLAHDDGTSSLYLHLDAPEVSVGARVARGQRIARSGNTGWSTGAHLHVQRQGRCGSWFCASQSMTFADVGMPGGGASVVSGNCP